ncbi:DNA-directed RNA polymerase I subunit RPA12 [Sitodiplosis mosellana]|uniref:DNA-directed RNA polymerase I subunit RPA12 n=1 Tax=Sitodiplosis mosellana TaxID=263140 RepID=UPI0024439294|nr:DNA-directed RNA polymerase I subunit RPA12 [Sitodiplosis mosellana]
MESIRITPGFCPNCGSILPYLRTTGNVKCYTCLHDWPPEVFGDMKSNFTINFNTYVKAKIAKKEDEDEGPIVERLCPKCGNEKMSYATLQLRSADEGQTVFYTCTNCKFKETENS